MGWVLWGEDDFERADGNIGANWPFGFYNQWQITSGQAHPQNNDEVTVWVNQVPSARMAMECDIISSADSAGGRAICLRAAGTGVLAHDRIEIGGSGRELYYNGSYEGDPGAYGANPTIRLEVNGDGDYEFFIDAVSIDTFTPVRAGGAGSNFAGMRNKTTGLVAAARIYYWEEDGDHPSVASSTFESGTSLGSSNAMPLPSGASAGDLIIAVIGNDNPGATAISVSTGWTPLGATTVGSNVAKGLIAARVLDGTSGDNILSVTGASQDYSVSLIRIAAGDHGVSDPSTDLYQAASSGTTGSANPPSLTPTPGSDDYLWLAAAIIDTTTASTLSSAPAEFGIVQNNKSAASTSSVITAVSSRKHTNSVLDPGTFINSSRNWIAYTIAVPPASSGGDEFEGASDMSGSGDLDLTGAVDVVVSAAIDGTGTLITSASMVVEGSVALEGSGSLAAESTTGSAPVFQDDFERSNRDLNGDNGWTAAIWNSGSGLDGYMEIIDGRCVPVQTGEWLLHRTFTDTDDYRIDVEIATIPDTENWRIEVYGRQEGPDDEDYFHLFVDQDGTLYLNENYFSSVIDSASYTPSPGDILSLQMVGTAISAMVNGVEVASGTSSHVSTGDYVAFRFGDSGSEELQIESISIYDLAEGTTLEGEVALTSSGTLTADATVFKEGAVDLSGSGIVGVAGERIIFGSADIAGSGVVFADSPAKSKSHGYAGPGLYAKGLYAGPAPVNGEAYLSGEGTLSVEAVVEKSGSVSLSGSGALDSAAILILVGDIPFTGTGTLISDSTKDVVGELDIAGSGTFTAESTKTTESEADISGSGTLAADGSVTGEAEGASVIEGSGTLDASAVVDVIAGSGLVGSGDLDAEADVTKTGAASLVGTGTTDINATVEAVASTSIDGSGTVAASADIVRVGDVDMSGSGDLSVDAEVSPPIVTCGYGSFPYGGQNYGGCMDGDASFHITGTGTVSATAALTVDGSVDLGGAGSVSVEGDRVSDGVVSFIGTGALVASPELVAVGETSIEGTGTIDVDGLHISIGTVGFVGTGLVSVDGRRITEASFEIEGVGTLDVSGARVADATAGLTGTGTLDPTAILVLPGSISIDGSGTIVVDGRRIAVGETYLSGSGNLQLAATIEAVASLFLDGEGDLGSRAVIISSLFAADPCRTFVVDPESRVYVVPAEGRTYTVEAETRVYVVEEESRTYVVEEESRMYTVICVG